MGPAPLPPFPAHLFRGFGPHTCKPACDGRGHCHTVVIPSHEGLTPGDVRACLGALLAEGGWALGDWRPARECPPPPPGACVLPSVLHPFDWSAHGDEPVYVWWARPR